MYYCGYMVLFSNVETGIGLFASSLPAIRRLYFLVFKPEHGQEATPPPILNNEGIVTIGGTGAVKNNKFKPRTALISVFSTHTERGESKSRVESIYGDWERLTDVGSDSGSKKIETDEMSAVELHPVKPV